jgi:hypothetical protein
MRYTPRGMGWHRDLPDFRDFFPPHPQVQAMANIIPIGTSPAGSVRVHKSPVATMQGRFTLAVDRHAVWQELGSDLPRGRGASWRTSRQLARWGGAWNGT